MSEALPIDTFVLSREQIGADVPEGLDQLTTGDAVGIRVRIEGWITARVESVDGDSIDITANIAPLLAQPGVVAVQLKVNKETVAAIEPRSKLIN